ncbi:hypothetical protein O4J56_17830 [Nocardiopsis sp. RSe5-2]|uniref:Uncharacterized protein n=1 Tax=Nocardiopsis endophytica TaxID=3018445 RepID=A0ABT4U6E0_9ACTN|nr:hypothetical protein [Nocardiopsis endophytica]MDA2812508.1 hypothetical protein [Nocardiopsis endophytica]
MNETDGIEESFDRQLHQLLGSARDLGHSFSRGLWALRQIHHNHQVAKQYREQARRRYEAKWEREHELLAVVEDEQWWEQEATPAKVAEAYQIALSWRDHEDEADRLDDVIYEEVRERYGVDLRTPTREEVQDKLEQAVGEHDRDQPEPAPEAEQQEEQERAADTEEERPAYDSAERREQFAEQMRGAGVDEALIAGRLSADAMNARPPQEAVHASRRLTASGMRARGRGLQAEAAMGR